MSGLTTTQLAEEMNVSKGRVSQWVSAGKLDGCFTGTGRARRFDLKKVAEALGRTLDKGQMLGNGAETKKAIKATTAGKEKPPAASEGGLLTPTDPDRYELARTQKVEEEARRLRRANALDEGTLVLAAEAARQVKRQMAQEIAQFETMLRDAARRIADELGVDYRAARQILISQWRSHRGDRSAALQEASAQAVASNTEQEADF